MNFQTIVNSLKNVGSQEPESEAYIVLEYLFGMKPSAIVLNKDKEYDDKKILEITEKRKNGIPLQYIIGKWNFMGEEFIVSPSCLIPRQDTEILVENAVKRLKTAGSVADLCTGSGCIGISLLKLRKDIEKISLVDISKDALEIAKKNAKNLGVYERCEFVNQDITTLDFDKKFDMILSNPPYIPTKDIENLSPEVKKEPFIALDGGDDGLDFVRVLKDKYIPVLNDGGYMLIEFGYDQGEKIREIFEDSEISHFEIIKDYSGNDRVALVRK